jgi:predicted PurR-regulated permease PerM
MARYISFAVLLGIIVVIGALFYKVMIGFFVPVFLAAVLVVVFRPLHRYVSRWVGHREHIAAGITTLLILLIVLIPASVVLSMAAVQGANLMRNFNATSLKLTLVKLRSSDFLHLEFPYAPLVQRVQLRIDDIQLQVSKEQSYAEMLNVNGRMQGDIAAIRADLKKFVPSLVQNTSNDTLQRLEKMRVQNGPPSLSKEKLAEEVESFFVKANEEFLHWESRHSRAVDTDEADTEDPRQSDSNYTPSGLPESMKTILEEARRTILSEGTEWSRAIATTQAKLDALTPGTESTEQNVVQLQGAAIELNAQWQRMREIMTGGPWLGALKELANPSDADIENLYRSFLEYLRPRLVSFTGDSAVLLVQFLVASAILLVSLYFFLFDGPRMIQSLMELSPLDDRYERELLAEFDRVSRAIVLAMILSALLQGVTAGIGYYFAGMPSLILLTALTATAALIPFIGPAIVWVPVCLYLLIIQENWIAAVLLALWGTFAVGTVDNFVKVIVLHGASQLHPLLGLLSVLGGIQTLGPIGIVVGPMVVVLLQTLLGILRTELSQFRKAEELALATDVSTASSSRLSKSATALECEVSAPESKLDDAESAKE